MALVYIVLDFKIFLCIIFEGGLGMHCLVELILSVRFC